MSTSPQTFSTESSSESQQHSLPLILTLVLLVLFFLGFFSIYFCRYITNVAWIHRHQPNAANQPLHSGNSPHTNGLHPSIVASFPTFTYALVKDHRRGKCGLECAVCLSEFSDNDVLRLLTVCSHAFHPDCIDLWFESHTTCPVCRRNLDLAEKVPEVRIPMPESEVVVREEAVEREVQEQDAAAGGGGESWQRISFKEEEEEEERRGERATETASEGRQREHVATMEWLPRSHSTGHSIMEDERFTLSLPENVKERKWKGSCIMFGELSNESGGGGVVVDEDQEQRKDKVMAVDFSTSTSQSQSHSHSHPHPHPHPPPDDLTHHACHSIVV